MDKNAIKKYAVWARRELISRVSQKALQYGISENEYADKNAESVNGKLLTAEEKHQRAALIEQINKNGYQQVMEEVAYTWFNRFCALRFMEVNGYLPTHVRVFSDEENNFKPQILAEAMNLNLPGLKLDKVYELKNDSKEEELFKYLLIIQCNALSSVLPGMFQKISDYTELLFPDNLLRTGSVVEQLVTSIPADDFNVQSESGQIEIIGWLYQYYISEKHEEVVDPLHGKTVKKEDVPAATQLFTTDWVVRYLIDNSVGRYWIERNPESKLKDELQYFVAPKNGEIKYINEKIEPKDLTVLDPCIGSGHFLIYAFDVLIKIYTEYGYSARDAAQIIVENNLFGLDIDDRATQLAYFSVMMKARQYDSRFFERGVQPKIFTIPESNYLSKDVFDYIVKSNAEIKRNLQLIIDTFYDAQEYGSILQIPKIDFDLLYKRFDEIVDEVSLFREEALNKFLPMVQVAGIMANKYAVVATNPPYLNKYDGKLKGFVDSNYKAYGGDLFSVFIYRNLLFCKKNGYSAYMTPNVWMFIKTYEKLRQYILQNKQISSLIQMAKGAFFKEATVDICAFVLCNEKKNKKGLYIRLEDFKGDMEVQRQKVLEALSSENCKYFFEATESNFSKIPGSPIAYWVGKGFFDAFTKQKISDYADVITGMTIGDNNKYLRLWFEVWRNKIALKCNSMSQVDLQKTVWIPYSKGGERRNWYGNYEYVVNWSKKDNFNRSKTTLQHLYLKEALTWPFITSGDFSARLLPQGFLWDVAGSPCFFKDREDEYYTLGFLCSKVANYILKVINPTINVQAIDIAHTPLIIYNKREVIDIASESISRSCSDWDSFETSWDFKKHPLIRLKELDFKSVLGVSFSEALKGISYPEYDRYSSTLRRAFEKWEAECNERFNTLKANEEELNRIFIDVYGLQDELTPEVEDKDVTVRKADLTREIKSLISYAVGCMFGRYSLDVEGLAYAGGEWDSRKYSTYIPDADNIIPICDDEYFSDDVVGRFVKFVEVVYGKDTLEENLKFIADALGGKGLPRDVIRDYFLNGFYADHLKVYQKRPIYWLFDSGKKNGFKALIYMHRYQPDTLARMRTDYVHEQQARYRTAIEGCNQSLLTANSADRVKLSKKLQALTAQADEISKFEEKVHHLADMMISIDLDDGVKHNYEIFKDVLAPIK